MEAKLEIVDNKSANGEKFNEKIENVVVAKDEELQSRKNVKSSKKFGFAYLSKKADETNETSSQGKSETKTISRVSKVSISQSKQRQGNVSSDQTNNENVEGENSSIIYILEEDSIMTEHGEILKESEFDIVDGSNEGDEIGDTKENQDEKNIKKSKTFSLTYFSKKARKTKENNNVPDISEVSSSQSENNEDNENVGGENQKDEISALVPQGLSSLGTKLTNKLFNKNSEKSISLSISLGSDGEGNNSGEDIASLCLNAVANSEINISVGQSSANEVRFSLQSPSNDTATEDKLQATNANEESEEEEDSIMTEKESEFDIVDGSNEGDEIGDTKENQDEKNIKKSKRFSLTYFSKKARKKKVDNNVPDVSEVSSSQSENNEDNENVGGENQKDEISALVPQGLSSLGTKLTNKLFNKNSEKSISLSISLGSDGEGNNSGEDIASRCLNAVANSEINISVGQSSENEVSFSLKSPSNDTATEDKLQATNATEESEEEEDSIMTEHGEILKECESDIVDGSNEGDEIGDTKENQDEKNIKKSKRFSLTYFSKKARKKKVDNNVPDLSEVSSSQSENNEDNENVGGENQKDEISALVPQGLSSLGTKLTNKLFNKNSEKSISLSISLGSDGEGNNSGEDIASRCLNAVANSEINISVGQSSENETSLSIKSSTKNPTQ